MGLCKGLRKHEQTCLKGISNAVSTLATYLDHYRRLELYPTRSNDERLKSGVRT